MRMQAGNFYAMILIVISLTSGMVMKEDKDRHVGKSASKR